MSASAERPSLAGRCHASLPVRRAPGAASLLRSRPRHSKKGTLVTNEHRFDRLHRTLTEEGARRGLLQVAGALMAGLALRSSSQRAIGKKRRKRNGKGKKKGKGHNNGSRQPSQPNQCGAAICDQEFVGAEVGECMAKCERCRLEDRFCVIEGDPDDPTKIATCCFEDQRCCQDTFACCPRDHTCCGGYSEQNRRCCPPNTYCCDSSAGGCCPDTHGCCPGVGCVNLETDPHHCGACGRECSDLTSCQDGECGCENRCPPNTFCCNSSADGCCDDSEVCCPGLGCRNLKADPHNCGICGRVCPNQGVA
jgi:hypothetical protein